MATRWRGGERQHQPGALRTAVKFDPLKQYGAIAATGSTPLVLAANGAFNTFAELVKYSKSLPEVRLRTPAPAASRICRSRWSTARA